NMIRTSSFTVMASILLAALFLGCNKKQDAKKEAETPTASAVSTPKAAAPAQTIKVGLPYVSREQYKPVVGKYGGQLVRDMPGEPKSFNPITAGETSSSDFTQRIFQGLTDEDPWTGETIPALAEKWETSADGLTWTFHLRKDAQFNNGTPLTADDVAFTWNQ